MSKDNMEPITPKLLNKRELHPRVRLSTSASGSQPSGNTKNDRILQTPSSNSKNKVEAHPRNVKSSLNKRNGTVKVTGSVSVQKSKKQDDSDYVVPYRPWFLDSGCSSTCPEIALSSPISSLILGYS
ncbi:hypothetical protein Tco_0308931 [Tanacetum coccineum]